MEDKFGVMVQIRKDFGVDILAITRDDLDPENLCHYVLSPYSDTLEEIQTPANDDIFSSVVMTTEAPFAVPELSRLEPSEICPLMKAEGYEAYLGVPLSIDGVVIGALSVMSRYPRTWTAADQTRLSSYGRIVETLLTDPQEGPAELELRRKS